MRRVVIALDSLKGSIGATDAVAAVADGWRSIDPDAELLPRPMADGGEGTLAAFAAAVPGARRMPVRVLGPDGTPVDAAWVLLPPTAEAPRGTGVVELASTSGIELLETGLRPWDAATTGFGEAIAIALDEGVSRLVLGIGSSASTDGGVGMLRALGGEFLATDGSPITPGLRGLQHLATVDLSRLRPLPPAGVVVLTDVAAPLLGEHGAAATFGPQKGLASDEIPLADAALARLAGLIDADPARAGAGAAGGTGFALSLWGADLTPGAAAIADLIGLAESIAAASVVVTGEGAYDAQSMAGKVAGFVARAAVEARVPAMLVAGRIDPEADTSGFAAHVSLTDLVGDDAALSDPAQALRRAGAVLARRSVSD